MSDRTFAERDENAGSFGNIERDENHDEGREENVDGTENFDDNLDAKLAAHPHADTDADEANLDAKLRDNRTFDQDEDRDGDPRAAAVTQASGVDDVDRDQLDQKQSDDAAVFGGGAFGSTDDVSSNGNTGIPATTTGTTGVTDHRFFQDSVSEKLRDRWQTIQVDFVDDPRHAVELAETLVEQVSTQLTEALTARRQELHGSWSKDGSTASAAHDDAVPTEDLRTALQEYRQVFNQLLAL